MLQCPTFGPGKLKLLFTWSLTHMMLDFHIGVLKVVTHQKVFFRKSLSKVTRKRNLQAKIEHVLIIVKVSFERRKIANVYMTHMQGFFIKSLLKATFKRKLSSVSSV